MAASEPRRLGVSIDLKPHAYDPVPNPELFEGVLARRIVAFFIDFLVIVDPGGVRVDVHFRLRHRHLRAGLAALRPAAGRPSVIWAIVYYGMTLGGPRSATIGMRVMDIEMRTWYGAPAYFVLGAVHAVVFWITVSMLTPLVLLVCLFNERRRLPARHPGRHRGDQQCGARRGAARAAPAALMRRPAKRPLTRGRLCGRRLRIG